MRTVLCLLALFLTVGSAPAGERVVLRARSFGGRASVRSVSVFRARSFGAGFHSFGFASHGYGAVGLGASYGVSGFRAFAGDPCYAPASEVVELKTTTQPVRQTTTTTTETTTTTTESTGVLKSSVRRFVR